MATTFLTYSTNLHSRGGQTQTEATALMSDATLRRRKGAVPFLNSILKTLNYEASICTTEEQYAPVRVQIVRVREALQHFGAL